MEEDLWANYARLQARANSTVVNDTYWATDEALEEVLDRIASGQGMPTDQQLDNFIGNRRRRLRQRRRILGREMPCLHEDGSGIDPTPTVRADVDAALTPLSKLEQEIVVGLAIGHTHREIARKIKRAVGSVKTWAHRARQKMAA